MKDTNASDAKTLNIARVKSFITGDVHGADMMKVQLPVLYLTK